MTKRNVLIATVVFLFGVLVSNGQNQISEGARPYSPTRLQWLVLEMEAQDHVELSKETGYSMDFVALDKANTILLYVRYLLGVDREIMNARIENAKDVINIKAKYEGWTKWLKIQEDVKMQTLPK